MPKNENLKCQAMEAVNLMKAIPREAQIAINAKQEFLIELKQMGLLKTDREEQEKAEEQKTA